MSGDYLGRRIMELLDGLARYSDDPGQLARLYLSPAHKRAADALSGWMREAGLAVTIDALGTVIGHYESDPPGGPALLIGSHIDTVSNAGKYDGTFGVIAGLVVVAELFKRGERFPFAIEVVAFGDEEGVRFPTTLTTSRALAGSFDPALLDMCDAKGVSLREALIAFGCDLAAIGHVAKSRQNTLAYIEPHIEQGPILEIENLPVGVVTAINGVKRFVVKVHGFASHSGTVPMRLRQDALAAAAEMILAVERIGKSEPNLVATVGRITALPGAVNVIPGDVEFTIDLRSSDDRKRDAAAADLLPALRDISRRRDVAVTIDTMHEASATPCSLDMIEGIARAVERQGLAVCRLSSGAGHDAMVMAKLCPVGVLFVRCAEGISHNPLELILLRDADICAHVLLDFVRNFR